MVLSTRGDSSGLKSSQWRPDWWGRLRPSGSVLLLVLPKHDEEQDFSRWKRLEGDGRRLRVAQGLFDDRKDGFPVIFHTDHVPPAGRCFVECFVQSSDMRVAVIGKFAHFIIMMHDRGESRSRAGCSPFQHLEVAVGIAKCHQWLPPDMPLNAHRFSGLVINEINLWQPGQDRLAVAHFIRRFDAGSDDVFWGTP